MLWFVHSCKAGVVCTAETMLETNLVAFLPTTTLLICFLTASWDIYVAMLLLVCLFARLFATAMFYSTFPN